MSFNINSDKEFIRGSEPKLIGDNELTIRAGVGSLEREILRTQLDTGTGLPRVGINRTGERVNNIDIVNGGSGYTLVPSVVIGPPDIAGGVQALASAFIFNGQVINIAINNPGSGYTAAPNVVITGGNGQGASATAVLDTVDYELDINGAIRTSTSIISDTARILNLDIDNFVTPDLELRGPNFKTYANATGTPWDSNVIIQKDAYRYFGANIYQALNGGETGSLAPTHTDGIELNGEVNFKHIGFRVVDNSAFGFGETGEAGLYPRSITPLLGDRSDKIATTEYVLNLATNDVGGRIYVSEQIGSDLNDGRSAVAPVRTIKKAAQLAWATPGVKETLIVSGGDYLEDNPISLPPDASVVGDNLRLVIIRPKNPNKHIFKFGDKNYVTGVTYRDQIDSNGDPVATWDFAMVFDDKQRIIVDYDVNGDFGVEFPIGHQIFGPDQFRVGFQQNTGLQQLQTGVEVIGVNTGARARIIGLTFATTIGASAYVSGELDIRLTSGSFVEGEQFRFITSASQGSSLPVTITQTAGFNTFRTTTNPQGIFAGGSYIFLDDADNSSFTSGFYEVAAITPDDEDSPTYWDVQVVSILDSPNWDSEQTETFTITSASVVSYTFDTTSLKSIRAEGEVVFVDDDITNTLPIQRIDFSQQGGWTDGFQSEQFGNSEDLGGIVFYTNELVGRSNIHNFKEGQEILIQGLPTGVPDLSFLNGKQRIYKVLEDADGRARRFVIPKKVPGINDPNFDPGDLATVSTFSRAVTISLLNSPNSFPLSTPVSRRHQDACNLIRNNREFIADEVVGRINDEFKKEYFSVFDVSANDFKIYLGTSRFEHTYDNQNPTGKVIFGGSEYNIVDFVYDTAVTGIATITTDVVIPLLGEDDTVRLAELEVECENGVKTYPSFNIPVSDTQCKQDIIHFLNALVRDLEFGSNHNIIEAAQKYIVGAKIDYIENEIVQTVRAIEYARQLAIFAMCNWRTGKRTQSEDIYLPKYSSLTRYFDNTVITATALFNADGTQNNSGYACDDVRSAIDTLAYLWTDVIANNASGTYLDAAYLIARNRDLIADQALIDTEATYPSLGLSDINQRKCRRDINFVLSGLIRDLILGGNSGIVTAAEAYFGGTALTGIPEAQRDETIYAFGRVRELAKTAIRNWTDGNVIGVTPTFASYNSTSGNLTVSFPDPSIALTTSDRIAFAEGALTFNCDSNGPGDLASPTPTDRNYGKSLTLTNVSSSGGVTTITTNVGDAGDAAGFAHTFVSALAGGTYVIYEPFATTSPIPKFEDWSILLYPTQPLCANVASTIDVEMALLEDILDGTIVAGETTKTTGVIYDTADIITYPDAYIYDLNNQRMAIRGSFDDYPIIEASPYTQNASVISFLGGSGALIDGSKVKQPNCPFPGLELDGTASYPNQGKSMVAAAFTIVSFGGTGYKIIEDGYVQLVSVFVIFCADGVLAESGGYASITNSATNFGIYALRGIGYRREAYSFDVATCVNVSATPTGRAILTVDGLGREPLEHYVVKIDGYENTNPDIEYFIDSVGAVGAGPPFQAQITIDDGQGQPMDLTDSATGLPVSTDVLVGKTVRLHRPSIVNSSSHTWEFAGSGTNYLALPENGGTKVEAYEQVSEDYGRVYVSGTDELGDFKVGTFARIENRTGNITFTGTVTISEVEFLKLKGGDVVVTGFSADNTLGGASTSNSVLPTQKAVRDYITNNLGPYINKPYSTNAVPRALVELTDSGKISIDQIPALRPFQVYTVEDEQERISIEGALAGDIAIQQDSSTSYILNNDLDSLFLAFQPDPTLQFTVNDIFTGSLTGGRIQATEYRQGVVYRLNLVDGGSGYTAPPNVTISGTLQQGGVEARAVTTIANGEVVTIELVFYNGFKGGKGYTAAPTVVIAAPAGSGQQATAVSLIESRLYGDIVNKIAITDTDTIESSDIPSETVNITRVVNTSSFDDNNWVSLSSNQISATDIVSGVIETDRLASGGAANSFTFLRGDQNFALAVQSIKGSETRYFDTLYSTSNSGSSQLIFRTNSDVLIGHEVVDSVTGIQNNTNITGIITDAGLTTISLNNPITSTIPAGTVIEFARGSSPMIFESSYTQGNFVDSIIIVNGGSGFTNGQYFDVELSGGTGTGLRCNIIVSGNAVDEITVTDSGSGYTSDFSISNPPTVIGSGSGLVLAAKISTVNKQYANVSVDIQRVTNLTISSDLYGTLGVSRYKKDQFNIGTAGNGSVEIKTGPGSGLDADLLDTKQGSFYLNSSNQNQGTLPTDRLSGTYNISVSGSSGNTIRLASGTNNPTSNPTPNNFVEGLVANTINNTADQLNDGGSQHLVLTIRNKGQGLTAEGGVRQMAFTDNDNIWLRGSGTGVTAFGTWAKMWTSLNDGIGSGMDADRLDGKQGSWYQNALNINSGTVSDNRLPKFLSATKFRDKITLQSFNGDPKYRIYLSGRILNVTPFTPGNTVNLYDATAQATGQIAIDNLIINDNTSDNTEDYTIIVGRLTTGNFIGALTIGSASNREPFQDFTIDDDNVVEVGFLESDGGTANLRLGRKDGVATSPGIYFNTSQLVASNYNSAIVATGGNSTDGSGQLNAIVTNANSFTINGNIVWNAGNITFQSTNVADTAVKRDGSGNFSAGTITASLTGAASLNVLKAGDRMSGGLTIGSDGTAASVGIRVQGVSEFLNTVDIVNDLSVDTDTLFVDVSTDRVGINAGTAPLTDLDIRGTGSVYLEGTSPTIYFNGTSDATNALASADMAVRLESGEDLIFYEPEDTSKVHFRIKDDTGVDAPFGYWINGVRIFDQARNLTDVNAVTLQNTSGGAVNFYNNSSTRYWRIGSNTQTNNYFTFEASDAVGGTAFTGSPALAISAVNNAVTINTTDTSGIDPEDGVTVRNYKLNVQGDVNFNGQLFQNNAEFVTSRWTEATNELDIYRLSKVGINKADPTYDLHVGGNVNIEGSSFTSGSNTKVLYVNGDRQYLDTYGIFKTNRDSVNEDITIPSGTNSMSAGPITINSGRTITIASGGSWSVV